MIALLLYLMLLTIKVIGVAVYLRRYGITPIGVTDLTVTICQAILSGDRDLEAALANNVKTLPDVNFIWLIDDDDQAARQITSQIVARFPTRRIRVMSLPSPGEGINPKLYKLEAGRLAAPAGILVVLDDDTRLPLTSLLPLLSALSRCELSTGLPYYRTAESSFGTLLAQFVNNNSALTYLPILSVTAPVSINGMSAISPTISRSQTPCETVGVGSCRHPFPRKWLPP
jgi:ceramide glucosyltransferase